MSLSANSQAKLEKSTESLSIDFVSSILLVFKILYKGLSSLSKQKIHKNPQVEILKNNTWLFTLVTGQEKKY